MLGFTHYTCMSNHRFIIGSPHLSSKRDNPPSTKGLSKQIAGACSWIEQARESILLTRGFDLFSKSSLLWLCSWVDR